jgi:hypothetical protein
MAMRIDRFTFGSIRIDGVTYEHDVVIAGGRIHKRKKKLSKPFRGAFGHTPLSMEEDIPWDCRRLVVGTGATGSLPVMDEVKEEAARRRVALVTAPTREAVEALQSRPRGNERDLASNLLICPRAETPLRETAWPPGQRNRRKNVLRSPISRSGASDAAKVAAAIELRPVNDVVRALGERAHGGRARSLLPRAYDRPSDPDYSSQPGRTRPDS